MELKESRRLSRELVLQLIYSRQMNPMTEGKSESALERAENVSINAIFEVNNVAYDDAIVEYAKKIMMTIEEKTESIDDLIRAKLKKWKIEELSVLDRIILNISVSEMLYHDIAPAISINEAVEIAKKYSGEQAGKFINGVLDRIAKDIKNIG